MLRVVPNSWWSWKFDVRNDSRQVASIDMSAWRERGALRIDGADYRVSREGFVTGDFLLESAGAVIARATKPSVFRREFEIVHQDRHYTLRARSVFRRPFVVLEGAREVGSIEPNSMFSWRTTADLPEHLPLPVRVFMIWLTFILWKRDADSAGAS